MPGKSSAESLLISQRKVAELYAFAVQFRELIDKTGRLRIAASNLGEMADPLRELLDEITRLRIEIVGVCNQLEEVIGTVAPGIIARIKTKSEELNDEKTPTQIARPCPVCKAVVYANDVECRTCKHVLNRVSTVRKKDDPPRE